MSVQLKGSDPNPFITQLRSGVPRSEPKPEPKPNPAKRESGAKRNAVETRRLNRLLNAMGIRDETDREAVRDYWAVSEGRSFFEAFDPELSKEANRSVSTIEKRRASLVASGAMILLDMERGSEWTPPGQDEPKAAIYRLWHGGPDRGDGEPYPSRYYMGGTVAAMDDIGAAGPLSGNAAARVAEQVVARHRLGGSPVNVTGDPMTQTPDTPAKIRKPGTIENDLSARLRELVISCEYHGGNLLEILMIHTSEVEEARRGELARRDLATGPNSPKGHEEEERRDREREKALVDLGSELPSSMGVSDLQQEVCPELEDRLPAVNLTTAAPVPISGDELTETSLETLPKTPSVTSCAEKTAEPHISSFHGSPSERDPEAELSRVLDSLEGVKKYGAYSMARCPAHDDHRPSLKVSRGDQKAVLVHCFAGCPSEEVFAAINGHSIPIPGHRMTVTTPKVRTEAQTPKTTAAGCKDCGSPDCDGRNWPGEWKTYVYRDERGTPLYRESRKDDLAGVHEKQTAYKRYESGQWVGGTGTLSGVRRVPFNLDLLDTANPGDRWFWVEGSKKAHELGKRGLRASTAGSASGWWREEFAGYFAKAGVRVAILPDENETGLNHANTVLEAFAGAGVDARILRLPGLAPDSGKDVLDWLRSHATFELRALVEEIEEPKVTVDEWEVCDVCGSWCEGGH